MSDLVISGATVWLDERQPGIEAVAVCIQRHGHSTDVLAVRRREFPETEPDVLCMPGGRVERETPRNAAVREACEETGIRLRPRELRWLGALEVASSRGWTLAVGVYWVSAPFDYEPGPGMGEPAMKPRWHDWADLADAAKHGRFAGPAMFSRVRMGVHCG
jgi:8-oxo-dGTP pyrophosphatase MutT (NUDIX family)